MTFVRSPWKYFKDSCEQSRYKIPKKRGVKDSASVCQTPLATPSRLKTKTKLSQSFAENDFIIREEDETNLNEDANKGKKDANESDFEQVKEVDYSSDEDEIKQINSSSDDEELRKEKLSLNASLISSKKFRTELKSIRVCGASLFYLFLFF